VPIDPNPGKMGLTRSDWHRLAQGSFHPLGGDRATSTLPPFAKGPTSRRAGEPQGLELSNGSREEPMNQRTLHRQIFTADRSLDFFTESGLSAQIGYGRRDWPAVLLKEILDNSLRQPSLAAGD
jgi:hypothetical protein